MVGPAQTVSRESTVSSDMSWCVWQEFYFGRLEDAVMFNFVYKEI